MMAVAAMGKVPPKKPERVKLKVVPPPRRSQDGSGLIETLGELDEVIRKHPGHPSVQATMAKVMALLDNLQGQSGEPESRGLNTRHERDAAGVHLQRDQKGRHDKKRAPAGFEYRDGMLWRTTKVFCDPSPRTEAIAKSLLVSLGHLFHAGGAQVDLAPLLRGARGGMMMFERSSALEQAFEALFGYRYGERASWSDSLAAQLEMDARHREEERLRKEHGKTKRTPDPAFAKVEAKLVRMREESATGSFWGPASGEEIRAYLLAQDLEVPPELTATAIDKMRESVGLNKGGSKRTARALVEDFTLSLKKNNSRRKKAKR
ncbi:MAG: hypothetical protein SFV15_16870 [Polyangiaceae bacterium]|nr:hypothetical protein [Polyangiaceae bacterium]